MALLTLLTLLAAVAACEHTRSCSDAQWPTLSTSKEHEEETSYGEDVILFCSSNNTSNLDIRNDEDQQLPANCLNSTTIQVSVIKPDAGWYSYFCTDSNTSCTNTMEVYVSPAMSVRAPRALQSGDRYLVPHGEAYDVFCSAHSVDLSIEVSSWSGGTKLLSTIVINKTTVMAKITNDTEGWQYTCSWRNGIHANPIHIIIGYFPEATKFRCLLYLDAKVECSWESSNVDNNSELYVLHGEGSTLICRNGTVSITRRCKGTLDDESDRFIETTKRISLQVKTCIDKLCRNQIFHKNPCSMLKLLLISGLKLRNSSSQGATITWTRQFSEDVHKVEYRLLQTDWRSVNASAVRCGKHTPTCELQQLALLCPDAHYELRVYARTRNATDDMYWSDPTTFFFFTAPGVDVDPQWRGL